MQNDDAASEMGFSDASGDPVTSPIEPLLASSRVSGASLPGVAAPARFRSPLSDADLALADATQGEDSPGGRLSLAPARGMISVKADLEKPDVETALINATGFGRPGVRKARVEAESGVLWMAPDELLVYTPRAEASAKAELIDQTLSGMHRLVVDISDARVVFRLVGRGARETLAKGAPIDLHPDAFRTGDLRRTRISSIAAAIYLIAPDNFEIICFRSHARALWRWLAASAHPDAAPGVFPTNG